MTYLGFVISRLIYAMALIFVARGHGLMAASKPNRKAVITGIVLSSAACCMISVRSTKDSPDVPLLKFLQAR